MRKLIQHTGKAFDTTLLGVLSKNTLDFIAVVRKDDRKIMYINDMGVKMFDYEQPSDLLGFYIPELRKSVPGKDELNRMDEEVKGKGHYSVEAAYVTKNGKVFWGRMQLNAFVAEETEYFLVQIEKIDRARNAEARLLNEQLRFDALLEYAPVAILIVNQQQDIMLMNHYALQLFGYSPDEYRNSKIEMLIPARFRKTHALRHETYYADPGNRVMGREQDLFAQRKDGSEFPVEISLSPYHANNETFVIVFVNDISERKQEEKEIRTLNAELEAKVRERTDELDTTITMLKKQVKETEEAETELVQVMQFQKAVLDSSGAMIIVTDPAGVITLFNTASEELLGYAASEVVGKQGPSLFHDVEETKQRAALFSAELNTEIRPGFDTYVAKSRCNRENTHEWLFVKKNGDCFQVSLTVTALRNDKDDITGFLYVAVDISGIKKTETELIKALEREKELNELKSRFVSMASHEFRTPLSTILSSIYLLQKYQKTEDQPQREKHIDRITTSVNMLTDILNDFLSVGKIEEGKVEPKFGEFNITAHIRAVMAEMKPVQKKGQHIDFHHKGEEMVVLDPSLLNHIVMNLLSNAIKFSPEGARIHIKTVHDGTSLMLSVKDNGIGISKEDQQHLFERFFRGRNVSAIQGTGLGLHIMQKYSELMNGKVVCYSEPDKGTEFIIHFTMKNKYIYDSE